ncbi:MAG: galactofuranosyltransferase [Muribaculaceae bacterium]|nr:galactofuranosyltransferase [Muribaculaceae bacterium]
MSYKYISHNYRNHTSAGNKAKSDVEQIMLEEGFRNIGLTRTEHSSKGAHFLFNLAGIAKATTGLRKGDILFLQYPLKKYFTYICKIAHIRGAKVAVLIHDLGSFRRKALTVGKELRRLGNADYIIATNKVMARHLHDVGLDRPMGSLDAWDYLTVTDPIPQRVIDGEIRIAYAGSLNERKNAFLWKWGNVIRDYVVDIYGSGFRMDQVEKPEKFFDHGFVDAENLIAGMTSDYGLVWDGHSTDSCEGDFGSYLALNTPHKVSLYLRARLPLIIWSGAAMADFVTSNGIGITVDNLEEINERIKAVTPEEYAEMRRNVDRVATDIAAGKFFRKAAGEAIRYFENGPSTNKN